MIHPIVSRHSQKACNIPDHEDKTFPLKQEVVEVASIDDNGVITKPQVQETMPSTDEKIPMLPFAPTANEPQLDATVRIVMPSGVKVEMSNNANAATIRNILGVLQTL